jgi:RNA polymerase sigma-70 factor (ECF subfamily)
MSATAAVSFVTPLTAERAREETVLPEAVTFEAAFRREFEQRYEPLARYLARLTGDSAAAADLAQEAFVRLFGRGSMPDDTAAWLVSVAHNLLRNERQQIARRLRLLERHVGEVTPGDAAASAHDVLETDERRARVRRALDTLAERDRQMLLLRYEGFSYREIARALEMNEASVGTLLTRAKTAFREALSGGGPDPEEASATD